MSLDPERRPVVYPVVVWSGVADWLQVGGDRALASVIRRAVQGCRLTEEVAIELTEDERARVQAVLGE